MARGAYGRQLSISNSGRYNEQASGALSGHLKLILSAACTLSCVYALSLMFIHTKPCPPKFCNHSVCDGANTSINLTTRMERAAKYYKILSFKSNSESRIANEKLQSRVRVELKESVAEEDMYKKSYNTSLDKIVFGIAASSKLWHSRKYYMREWWQKKTMRGFVWLDQPVNRTWDRDVPPFKISANTSHFQYSRRNGNRAALRLARIVTETFRLGLKNVDWFVMGDDDTIFFTDNLVRMLSNYDPKQMHYIGSQSESHVQNTVFSYGMAYGGGGFAISYPLAKALAATQDDCLHRYPELFGSDDRMHACITELGVPITKNQGFHQFDIYGNPMGLLAAHPLTPLLSIHHLDVVDPFFPKMNRLAALRHLMKPARIEQSSMLQQTITYARRRRYSFSISSGYVVRVYRKFMAPWELEEVPRTFFSWYGGTSRNHFPFNIREIPRNPCEQPTLFFMNTRLPQKTSEGLIETVYMKEQKSRINLTGCDAGINSVVRIRVRSTPLDDFWFETRRHCGRVASWRNDTIDIYVKPCQEGELIVGS